MDGEEVEEGEEMEGSEEVNGDISNPMADISLSSVVGLTNPKTIKLRGYIEGKEVILMVDPGATNNFISLKNSAKAKPTLYYPCEVWSNFGKWRKN